MFLSVSKALKTVSKMTVKYKQPQGQQLVKTTSPQNNILLFFFQVKFQNSGKSTESQH